MPTGFNKRTSGRLRVAGRLLRSGALAFVLALTLALPQLAHALSQTRSPGACATGGGAGDNWSNAGNALSSNDADATVSVDGDTSEALECTNFGFAIPADAGIVGIEVNVERRSNRTQNGGSRDASLFLLGGTLTGSNLATATTYTTADVIEGHGGTTETWGNTWTVAQVNASGFGAALRVTKPSGAGQAHIVSVDHVEITVHYNLPPPAPALLSPADAAILATPAAIFDWTDVIDPDADTVTYDIQADNGGCGFPSPEINVTNLAVSDFTAPPLADGTYCWRARAVDQFGLAGPWSTTRNVTIQLPPLSSQTRSPGACVTGGGAGNAWINPGNAVSSNNSDATVSVDGSTSEALECTNYGFAIPAGATIVGIEVNVERASSSTNNGGSRDGSLLLLGGTLTGSDLATATTYTTSDVVEAHGGSLETWGNAWTVVQINAAAFGAALRVTKPSSAGAAHTVSVDHVEITVYYTLPPPGLVSATLVCGTTNSVEVLFSKPVTAPTAENPANYALSGGATVSAAVLGADARIVTLTTSVLAAQNYTLTVNNVADSGGGTIQANSQTTFYSEGGYLSGLRGSYFANMTLAGSPAGQRVDGPVDFDWVNGAPGVAGIGADNFSVRWEGFVSPSETGNYTFRTRSDDGVRLYVDGALVIDNWTDHAATDNDSAPVALTAGQRYPVVMEFYENGGQAVAQLSWSGPGTGGFQFIPRSALSHFCGLPAPLAFYKLDETSWNGTAGEVEDSSGNGLNGTAAGGAVPAPAQVCNGALLNGSSRYLQVGGLSGVLNATASLAFWIRTTQSGNDTGWQAPGVSGVELSGGADDIFWGWLDASGRIGVSVANDFTTKSTVAINDGSWRHVVLTRDHVAGTYQIFIDGALNATGSIATGVIGTPFSSIGRIEDTGGTPEHLNGQLDEVRIYGTVLSATEVVTVRDATRPCVSTVDHYYVQHASSGINCQAEAVTITAHDLAHAPTSAESRVITMSADRVAGAAGTRGDWTLLAGTGSLANGTADDGVATYTFGAGETAVVLAYKNTWVQTVNISVTDGISTDTSGNANADAGYNQNLSFEPSGFRFVDGNNSIPAQTAGVSGGPFYLQAIQTGTGGCTTPGPCAGVCTVPTGFENGATVAIELAFRCDNPTTCQAGQQVSIINNGTTAIAANPAAGVGSYTSKTLLFGADGRAAFNFVYPDVGAISLHVRYNIPLGTGAASGNLMTGASNSFVVRPYGFVLSNLETTAGAVANPGASDHTGGVFIRAGDDFSATVTAVNFAGNATPNYGREMAPETVRLTSALVAPGGGANPALANPAAFGAFTGGAATGTTFAWGEVGIITLTPEVGDADYLGAGNVTGTASGNVGRFIPYDFALARNAPFFESGCSAAGKDAFTYVGEGFTYLTAPVLTVTARNRAGGTTQNYRGDFWKITNATLNGKTYSVLAGSLDVSGIAGADPAIAPGGNGTGTLTFSAGTGLRFVRSTPVVPFNAEIALGINVADADGTVTGEIDGSASTNPVRFGTATAGNGIPFSGTIVSAGKTTREMRFGRLRIDNAFGTTRLDLPLGMQAQYYDANGFRQNADDSCTSIPATSIATNFAGGSNLQACETAIAPAGTLVLVDGRANGLKLRAPGTGNDGRVDLRVNLSGASGNSCIAVGAGPGAAAVNAALPHLQGNWGGGAYDQDPVARATFGIYRNANEFIYFQENF